MQIDSPCQQLSPTQKRCLRLWHEGLSGPRIAQRLEVSKSTVETHLAAARRVLAVSSSAQAAEMLHRFESEAPQNVSTYPARVDPEAPAPSPSTPPASSTPWRVPLPFRLKGEATNDLSVRQRLALVFLIALGLALGIGSMASALRFLNDLVLRRP